VEALVDQVRFEAFAELPRSVKQELCELGLPPEVAIVHTHQFYLRRHESWA
jgi:hypothetical protein